MEIDYVVKGAVKGSFMAFENYSVRLCEVGRNSFGNRHNWWSVPATFSLWQYHHSPTLLKMERISAGSEESK